jgi:hypothetical protein
MAIDFPASPTLNDVFTVGNVTYVWDGTKWTASVTGGISLDKIEEGNTSAEVIDTGSDGRFVVTTEGTERLRVTNTGRVGIGTTAPNERVTIASSTLASYIQICDSSTGTTSGDGFFIGSYNGEAEIRGKENSALKFSTNNTERVRIDSSGRLGIGTSSPGAKLDVDGGDLLVQNAGSGRIFIKDKDAADKVFALKVNGDIFSVQDSNNSLGFVADVFKIYKGASESSLVIDSSGNVGIGTTSPDYKLTVADTSSYVIQNFKSSNTEFCEIRFGDTDSVAQGKLSYNNANDSLSITVNAAERARIDSSGRLLVGTSAAPNLNNGGGAAARYPAVCFYNTITDPNRRYTAAFIGGADNSNGALIRLGKNRGTSATAANIVNNNDEIGKIDFVGADGTQYVEAARIVCEVDGTPGVNDMPGRIVLSTTADGASSPTERMRIRANGELTTLSSIDAFAPKSTVGAGTSSALIYGRHSATTVNDGTTSFIVWTNGNVQNTNNSYGAISDIKLKENIVDANSQWDDLKALQVRNYNFKEGQTHTQIGLVAQEAELVSPGLVSESPDRDEDGNDLGTVTKSVNYSVLYMKAVKALQEAMERIETLEGMIAVNNITIDEQQHQLSTLAARLTALESA